jgi:ribose transport system substrate-binding protein
LQKSTIKQGAKGRFKMLRRKLGTLAIVFVTTGVLQLVSLPAPHPITAQTSSPSLFAPTQLIEIATVLGKAVKGQGAPDQTPLAIVANDVAPFWTAGQIGSQRAASELGAPVIFNAPIKPGDTVAQIKIVQNFIQDGYKGIAFSAIDPTSIKPVVQDGIAQKINFITLDSDAPQTGRLVYIGTNNYNAGIAAANVLLHTLGPKGGKVIGMVGALTAQNAIDRIRGIQDTIKGSKVVLEDIMIDDLDPLKAESNADEALSQYPDLAAFVGIYSYDGPAAGNALKTANKVGVVKLIAFDLEPETMTQLQEGVVAAAIGQRPYFMGYLSVYTLYALSTVGSDQTLALLRPYMSGDHADTIDTGVDIVTPENLPQYSDYLNSIGIKSQ